MSNEKHTEEPWEVKGRGFAIYRQGYYITSTQGAEGTLKHIQDTNRANAERIVDCVNSCAGINPEAVPKMIETIKDLIHEVEMGYRYDDRDPADVVIDARDVIREAEEALAGKESE